MSALEDFKMPTPAIACPYRMKTTQMMQMRNGVAWTADLYLGNTKIGNIEQEGNGGCDWVDIIDRDQRTAWDNWCKAAFPGDASAWESATYHLMMVEDGQR